MRLWTVHPQYLDAKGLTALWREGLLARAVLRGKTKGYTNHPQLVRFKNHPDPLAALDAYMAAILAESRLRGYKYDSSKIDESIVATPIEETRGQLLYEWEHLRKKLERRDPKRWEEMKSISTPECHPAFFIIEGDVREWEKTTSKDAP